MKADKRRLVTRGLSGFIRVNRRLKMISSQAALTWKMPRPILVTMQNRYHAKSIGKGAMFHYDFFGDVPPRNPEGEKKFQLNKPSRGYELNSKVRMDLG